MSTPPIVVTGCTGFIAKHVVAELLKRGHNVRGTLRDMRKADDVRRAVARAGVISTAARTWNPASRSPLVSPPHPANRSMAVGLVGVISYAASAER